METAKAPKAALREWLREKAKTLDAEALRASDERIGAAVLALPEWRAARTALLYASVGTEPDTRRLIRAALAAGKRVALPRCLGWGVMEARVIRSPEELAPGRMGIPEPSEKCPLLAPEETEIALIPCLGADARGHRLGHGAGYYDRYLRGLACLTVCLCREAFLLAEMPTEAHDRPVDRVITEAGSYPRAGL